MQKIVIKPGQNLWFTSDTHYSHKNICRGVSEWPDSSLTRDFQTIEQMNKALVDNINACVKEDDILIHLGDWSFGGFPNVAIFFSELKVNDVRIMLGNHDERIEGNKDGIQALFTQVWRGIQNLQVAYEGEGKSEHTKLVISHYPIASWENMNRGWIHLHGHVHLHPHKALGQGKSLDVGVDGNNLKPYSFDEIRAIMSKQPIKHLRLPQDHHED